MARWTRQCELQVLQLNNVSVLGWVREASFTHFTMQPLLRPHWELKGAFSQGGVCDAQGNAQRKAEAKRREKEEAAASAALRSLAAREAQQATLLTARLELESLRVLLERIGRRERIKHQRAFAPPLTLFHFPRI